MSSLSSTRTRDSKTYFALEFLLGVDAIGCGKHVVTHDEDVSTQIESEIVTGTRQQARLSKQ